MEIGHAAAQPCRSLGCERRDNCSLPALTAVASTLAHGQLLDLETGALHHGHGAYVGDSREWTARWVPTCADLRLHWPDARAAGGEGASEALPWLLLERPIERMRDADDHETDVEWVHFEVHHMQHMRSEAAEGDKEGEGEEGEELNTGRLRYADRVLRTTPASAALRRLADSKEPEPLLLRRPCRNNALINAANWRWLVIIDVSGVHVVDFVGTGRH